MTEVKAKVSCFCEGKRRREGEVFFVSDPKMVSKKNMEVLSEHKSESPKPVEEKKPKPVKVKTEVASEDQVI